MKFKTIKKIINKKVNKWIDSIKEELKENEILKNKIGDEFVEKIYKNIIVTGGSITSMLLNKEPNDFDIYFTDIEIAEKVAEFYCKKKFDVKVNEENNSLKIIIPSSGIYKKKISEKNKNCNKFKVSCITDNAITLTDNIQLITRFIGTPEEIHRNFDYSHTRNYWKDGQLILNNEAVESIIQKELKYVGSLYPVSSLFRIKKFLNRGWNITAGEMLKIIYDVSLLDLTNIDVLKEQLIGVDVSYFITVIDALIRNDKDIDRTYLFNLIDEVFDVDIEEEEIKNNGDDCQCLIKFIS